MSLSRCPRIALLHIAAVLSTPYGKLLPIVTTYMNPLCSTEAMFCYSIFVHVVCSVYLFRFILQHAFDAVFSQCFLKHVRVRT